MIRPRVLVSFRSAPKAEPYLAVLRSVGIDPVPCTPDSHPLVSGIEGLVLTGGSDVDPKYYGQQRHPELGEVDAERDAFELGLLAMADATELPMFAICRGLQLLNVHRGGTLLQHLPQADRHRRNDTLKSQPVHAVRVEPKSRLAAILGTTKPQVNSRHHQAIDQLGGGLRIAATDAEDGVIEAVEDPSRPSLIAVQWHPEDQASNDPVQRRLFESFASCFAIAFGR